MHAGHHVQHDGVDAVGFALPVGRAHAGRPRHIEVQITIAQMAVNDRAHARVGGVQQRLHFVNESRHAGDGHRNVVLDVGAVELLRLADVLAHCPELFGLRLRAGDQHVVNDAARQGFFQRALKSVVERRLLAAIGGLHHHVPGVGLGKQRRRGRKVLADHGQAGVAHQLKGGEAVAHGVAHQAQQFQRLLRRLKSRKGHCLRLGGREQLEHRRRDDAQRAF